MYSPEALVAAITAVAIGLADGRSDDEIIFMGGVLIQLGTTVQTIAEARAYCKSLGGAKAQTATAEDENIKK